MVERAAAAPLGLALHMSRTLRVPIFPLPGAILFPRSQLPLHIFEPRYRDMVRDAIDGGGQIAMIQPHRLDDDNLAPLYSVGCVGELVGVEELDDGRYNIVLLGSQRFRFVKEADTDAAYRCADVDIAAFDDDEPEPLPLIQRAEVEREARRLGDALGLAVDWAAVKCWSMPSRRSRRSTSAQSRRFSSKRRSTAAPTCSSSSCSSTGWR